MKIGIIGAGNVGSGLGKRLAQSGHDIMVSFARTPEKVAQTAAYIDGGARAGSPEEAAAFGDVVIVATPWGVTLNVMAGIVDHLAGKIVWDTTNPFTPDMTELMIGTTTSAGEELAKVLPGVHVVKAVPPFAEVLHSPSLVIDGRRPGVFVCSDDASSRSTVARLVEQVGAEAVNAGPLKLARFTEPLGMLVTNLGYLQGFGSRIGTILIRDQPAA